MKIADNKISQLARRGALAAFLAFAYPITSSAAEASAKAPKSISASTDSSAESPWNFEIGASAGTPAPLLLLAGVRYNGAYLRAEGLGNHRKANDYWCGFRGSLGFDFLNRPEWGLELGTSAGYSYAEAPDGMHRALNEANGATYLYPYSKEETLDVSAEAGARLFGFHTRIEIPFLYPMGNKRPRPLWRAGYTFIF